MNNRFLRTYGGSIILDTIDVNTLKQYQRKPTTPKRKPTQRKATTPKRKATQRKATTPKRKPTTPKRKATQSNATPKRKATQSNATPKRKPTQRKTKSNQSFLRAIEEYAVKKKGLSYVQAKQLVGRVLKKHGYTDFKTNFKKICKHILNDSE